MPAIRNPNLGSSQARARRRRLFFIRFYIILFLVLVILFGLAIFSGSDKIIIKNIIVSGNAVVPEDAVLSIINRDLAGRYAYLFARKNFLLFPRLQIVRDLLTEIKIIKTVDISWAGWQKISITITERKPHSVWCGEQIITLKPTCYFADRNGYIYSLAPDFTGTMFIRNYGLLTATSSPIGQYFLPAGQYGQIFSLIDVLNQNNLKVVSVSFDGQDYEFVLLHGPKIIFNSRNGFESAFENLFSTLRAGELDLINEAQVIDYIDLRFDNKIVIGRKKN